jgi:PTS system mannose-specific IIC component
MGFGLNFVQIFLIIALQAYCTFDIMGPQIMMISTTVLGWLVGLICGDGATGLWIGATLHLMSLGVVGLGGASVPDYAITCIITTIITCTTGQDYSVGLTVGLPVGMLAMYLDVAVKTLGGPIQLKANQLVDAGEFDKGINFTLNTLWLNIIRGILPIAITLIAGQPVVEAIVKVIPEWLYKGMQVAGSILPVTGMAILLNYMPVRKHFPYLILGFVLYSYLGLSTLPIAMIGLVFAVTYFQREIRIADQTSGGDMEDE